ncbi:MAG TPA: GNAT family N-acetyltransferase [Xanthobacteraceae bacterium]|nr:GNAT family N-acetyltransferase [Xanthobacteraceae bacterium]
MPEQTYSVRFVGTEKAIPAGLWAACFPPPVEGHWWYRVLEASGLEHQFQFLYGLIEHDGRPVGIAPMFTMRLEVEFLVPDALIPFLALIGKLLPSLSAPTGLFIGSPCSDEGTVGLLPDVERRDAFLALQKAAEAEAARRGAGLVAWKDFPASEETDLAWLAQRAGLFRLADFPGTVVALPGPRKEDYLAQLSTSRRHNLKRKLKRSAQAFQPLIEAVQSPDAATLDEIYGLFEQTRARAKTTFEDLGRSFFENVARERVSHFIILREPETRRAAAFMLCFLVGDHVINKYIGLDYSRPKDWFLYFRLFDAALDWALAQGATAIQSGQTGYSGKLEQGHSLYPLTVYAKHRNAALHGVCRMIVPRIGWATLDDDLATYLKAHPDADTGR